MASVLPTLRFIAHHPLSSRRPLSAYWRYLSWQIRSRIRSEVEFDWIEGSKLVVSNGMTGATGNIYCGLHEFSDMAFLLHLLRPGDLFVDVGANVGSYTVLASAVCKARSIAIEPDPNTVRALAKNIEINALSERVTVIEAAVGAQSGSVAFTTGRDTMNHVAGSGDHATRQVLVRTLDDILCDEAPVLIKMDVEGYEPEVISGARATLKKPSLIAIITESSDPFVHDAIQNSGFVRAAYCPLGRTVALSTDGQIATSSLNKLFVRPNAVRHRVKSATSRIVAGVSV
ncbi:MAG: FkbM family methyltransferase [Hyphomicrobiaceae bacterium]